MPAAITRWHCYLQALIRRPATKKGLHHHFQNRGEIKYSRFHARACHNQKIENILLPVGRQCGSNSLRLQIHSPEVISKVNNWVHTNRILDPLLNMCNELVKSPHLTCGHIPDMIPFQLRCYDSACLPMGPVQLFLLQCSLPATSANITQ